MKAPLLLLQGNNDPRVPKEEADQVVELLKKDGKNVDVHYYANEGHGFEKRENQIDAIRRTLDWFDKPERQQLIRAEGYLPSPTVRAGKIARFASSFL